MAKVFRITIGAIFMLNIVKLSLSLDWVCFVALINNAISKQIYPKTFNKYV